MASLSLFGFKTLTLLSIFLLIILFHSMLVNSVSLQQRSSFDRLFLPPNATGSESIAFGRCGQFFTGVADGRILRYQPARGRRVGTFQDFAYTSPNRSRALCDGTTDMGPTCERPLGLGYNSRTGQLFICDAFHGLLVDGPNRRLATQIVTGAEGQPFKFCDGLDVDQNSGVVYFTDARGVYDFKFVKLLTLVEKIIY